MRQNSIIYFILLSFMLGGISACKSSRSTIKIPIREEGSDYLFSKMNENEFKFETIEARFDIEYNENRKFLDFKGQMRIIKDSVIWISFNQDLGIEIARILITQDSVKLIDRFNKKYLISDWEFINKFLNTNIDFGILQSIILGNDFEYYDLAKFKASIDNGLYKLTTGHRSKLKKYVRNSSDADRVFLQDTWLHPETFKIVQIKLKELTKESKKLSASYSSFTNMAGQLFPEKIDYLVEAENEIKVRVNYNRIVLNEPVEFPFKIPSKYEPTK